MISTKGAQKFSKRIVIYRRIKCGKVLMPWSSSVFLWGEVAKKEENHFPVTATRYKEKKAKI